MSLQEKRRQNSETLYYRLYIASFQGSKSILQHIRKDGFYRLSAWHRDTLLADMVKGVNPVVLADKIFLGNAHLNFQRPSIDTEVTLKLECHYQDQDSTLAESCFSLEPINKDFREGNIRYHPQLTTILMLQEQELVLTFNIFVDSSKSGLDAYINNHKKQEREVQRLNKELSSKLREKPKNKSYKEIVLIDRKSSISSQFRFDLIDLCPKKHSNSVPKLNKKESSKNIPIEEDVFEENKQEDNKILSFSSLKPKSYLQINSAVKRPVRRDKPERKTQTAKPVLDQIQEKDNRSFSSQKSGFSKMPRTKAMSFNAEGTSIISDGSEASEMIENNLNESYSDRAVSRFKARILRCMNVTFVILAIVLLYFLFIPRVKFTKPDWVKRNRGRHSEGSLEI